MFGADAVEYLQNRADSIIRSIVSNAVSSLAVNIPRWVISFLSSLPRRLVSVTVTVVASFYFCLDYDKIKKAVLGHIPKIISERLPSIKRRVYKTASGYLRAFLFLFILTFCQLYVGFSLFRVSYPFILALTVSFIDILPVLGVGAVLIPWGLLELIVMKDMYTGIGLLVLYVAITVIRQIVEPRVIAVSLGLHPIITLFAMYVGLWLFGFLGMILAPVMIHILFGGLGEGIDKQSDI